MGVTIHYQGRLRSAEDAYVLLNAARAEAESLGWQVRRLEPFGVAIQPHEHCDPIELKPDQDLARGPVRLPSGRWVDVME